MAGVVAFVLLCEYWTRGEFFEAGNRGEVSEDTAVIQDHARSSVISAYPHSF